jgi:hypothetical protein
MSKLHKRCVDLVLEKRFLEADKLLAAFQICAKEGITDPEDLHIAGQSIIAAGISLIGSLPDEDEKQEVTFWVFEKIVNGWALNKHLTKPQREKIKQFLNSAGNIADGFYHHSIVHIFKGEFDKLDECIDYFAEEGTPDWYTTVSRIIELAFQLQGTMNDKAESAELRKWLYEFVGPRGSTFQDSKYAAFVGKYEDDIAVGLAIDPKDPAAYYSRENETYKERLIVGEGNFTYTRALLTKHAKTHPKLGNFITTTEYKSEEKLRANPKIEDALTFLTESGAQIIGNVDARLIGDEFSDRRFHRIHFNMPHDGKDCKGQTLPVMIKKFFASAKKLQENGDRIHMALSVENESWRQAYYYGIYEASARAGYKLIKRRRFGQSRYSGYEHTMTTSTQSAPAAEAAREFIFERTDYSYESLINQAPPRKIIVYGACYNYLPALDTDVDSSDYELQPKAYGNKLK